MSVFDLLGLNIKIWEAVLPYPVVKEVSAEYDEDFEEASEKLQGQGVIKEENKLTESNSPSCSEEFNDIFKRRAAALKDDLMNTCDEGGNISIFSEQPFKMIKAKQDINSANLSDPFWSPHKLSILSTYFSGRKNSNCEKCGNRRKSRGAHLFKCEQCEIVFLCDECQMPFASKGSLRTHKRRNHEESIEIYKCDECEKTFMSKGSLLNHKRSKHEGEIYECQECEMPFASKGSLRNHKQNKHEGLVYSCQFCEYKAGQKVGLKIHILNKHPKMKIVLENP